MYLIGCTEDQCADGEHMQPCSHLLESPLSSDASRNLPTAVHAASIKPFAAEGRGQELVLASAVAPEVVEERKQVLKSMDGARGCRIRGRLMYCCWLESKFVYAEFLVAWHPASPSSVVQTCTHHSKCMYGVLTGEFLRLISRRSFRDSLIIP